MHRSRTWCLVVALLSAFGHTDASAQSCTNAPGKASCRNAISVTGPTIQPEILPQETCSVVGVWKSGAGATATVKSNLTGTFDAPYCPRPHSLTVTLQGNNKFRVQLIWTGSGCQNATVNMAFVNDCNTAQGPYVNEDGSTGTEVWTRSKPQITLTRDSLMVIKAQGTPSGGTFSYKLEKLSGTSLVGWKSAAQPKDNPNTINLTNPANPNSGGAPAPGGLASLTATYTTTNSEKASKQVKIPTFGLSCYYTASEVDWGTPPDKCKSITINGQKYSGIVKDPLGLSGTYCSSFIAQVKLQGSAFTRDSRMIQYDPKSNKIREVSKFTGADGSEVVAGRTLARDRAIIPKGGVRVSIDRVGAGLLANDTGGAIKGYRIDLYKGAGIAACRDFSNIISVSACAPGNDKCPARNVP